MSDTEIPQDRIVVGVDGSRGSMAALRYARTLSRSVGLPVVAVLVDQDRRPRDRHLPWRGSDPVADAAEHLSECVRATFPGESAPPIEQRVITGRPVPALVEVSAGSALLVLGTRGRGPLTRGALGSVSAGCAAGAACPVVVVPDRPDAAERLARVTAARRRPRQSAIAR